MDTLLTVTLKKDIETINEDGSMQVSEMNYTQPYEITKRTIHTYDIKNYYYIHPQKIKT